MHPRILAALSKSAVEAVLVEIKLPMLKQGAMLLARQVCMHLCLKPPESELSAAAGSAGRKGPMNTVVEKALRKVKMANVLDPIDETEIVAPSSTIVDEWFANYRLVKRGAPLVEVEPTPDQISAMHARVVELGSEPYADFSSLTSPHGRRMAKHLRHRGWLPQPDGSYMPTEMPGPASFEVWEACFGVYEVCLLMLRYPKDGERNKGDEVVTPNRSRSIPSEFEKSCKSSP